ncbi:MAG: hypothetical protein WBK32_00900 [Candidatus Saccharicenans sp.]
MRFDYISFFAILCLTILVGWLFLKNIQDLWERLVVTGFILGFCFYSGIGAAYNDVPCYYRIFYFGFLIAFACAYIIFRQLLKKLNIPTEYLFERSLISLDRRIPSPVVIAIYMVFCVVPLIYPELKLGYLISPPHPDLNTYFFRRWQTQSITFIEALANYAQILLVPFFYIALFRYRNRIKKLIIITVFLLYIGYVRQGGYIGRSDVLIAMGTIWIAIWADNPKSRRALAVITVMALPFVLAVFYYYSIIRIGGDPKGIKPLEAALLNIQEEISLPPSIAVPLIESGARVDMGDYVKWICTLPLPKFFFGRTKIAEINYEISEVVLSVPRGEAGYNIVLPGLVGESVYVYGKYFFWVHAVFIAFIAAFLMWLIGRVPHTLFLKSFIVMTFAYHMNRGGISGPLAILINSFLLFYLYLLVTYLRKFKDYTVLRTKRRPII